MERTYIGDGVYASHDGYRIWLRTERGPGVWHEIALEPDLLAHLDRYREMLAEKYDAPAYAPRKGGE